MATDKQVRFYRSLYNLRTDRETKMTDTHINLCIDLAERHLSGNADYMEKQIIALMGVKEGLVNHNPTASQCVLYLNNMLYNFGSSKREAEEGLTPRHLIQMMHYGNIIAQAIP